MKKFGFIILSFFLFSCSYKLYVDENQNGRKELKSKKFAEKFEPNMLNEFDYEKIYFSFYESKAINYKLHSYLRFFPSGQYAMFYEQTDSMPNLNNIEKAYHVGYFIVDNNVLKLETPTGNGNTPSYRIINKFQIRNDTLVEYKNRSKNRVFIGKTVFELVYVEPDW